MTELAEQIAAELRKRKGAVLVDVQVQGSGSVPPDSSGLAVLSAAADGDKLTVGLAYADEPGKKVHELVVESPSGFKQHKSGVWDIARARSVSYAGRQQLDTLGGSLAVRFLFQ